MNNLKNNKEHFEILRKISKKADISQRELSKELGFSLTSYKSLHKIIIYLILLNYFDCIYLLLY